MLRVKKSTESHAMGLLETLLTMLFRGFSEFHFSLRTLKYRKLTGSFQNQIIWSATDVTIWTGHNSRYRIQTKVWPSFKTTGLLFCPGQLNLNISMQLKKSGIVWIKYNENNLEIHVYNCLLHFNLSLTCKCLDRYFLSFFMWLVHIRYISPIGLNRV